MIQGRSFLAFSLALLVISFSAGCAEQIPRIRMSLPPVMGALPVAFARGWGLFDKHELEVNLVGLSDTQERSAALMAGEIDAMICDVTTAILLAAGGSDVLITSAAYQDGQESQLLLMSPSSFNIDSLDDLLSSDTSKIATIYRSDLEYQVDLLLDSKGYDSTEGECYTYWTDMLALALWFGSELVPAAALPEPYVTYIANFPYKQGQLELVRLSDFDGIDLLPSVVIFRRQLVEKSPEAIEAFYAAYSETIELANNSSREELVEIGIDEALSLFFPGLAEDAIPVGILDSFEIPQFRPPCMIEKEQFDDVIDWIISKRYARTYHAYDEMTTERFIQ